MADETNAASDAGATSDPGVAWLQDNAANYDQGPSGQLEAQIADVIVDSADQPAGATEAAAAESTTGEEVAGEEGSLGSEPDSPIYTKALTALTRGLPEGIRQKTLDSMTREEILEVGLGMADGQAEQDRIGAELGRFKEKDSNQTKTADSGEPDTATAEPAPSANLDLAKVLEPYDLDLNPEDLPEALSAVANAAVKQARQEVSNELAEMREGLDGIVNDQVGRQLEERFPQLRDATHKAAVEAKMRELEPGMEYAKSDSRSTRTQKRMELACQIVLGAQASQLGKTKPRKRNQPPGPSRKPVSNQSQTTQQDKDFAFLRTHEETGGDLNAAKRAYGG